MERGFTLIEMVLAIALIAILSAGGFAIGRTLASDRGAQVAGEMSAAALRDAQARAAAMAADTSWGVRVSSVSVTVFSGTSYATRDTAGDRVSSFAAAVVLAGDEEIVFAKGGSAPAAASSTSFTIGGRAWHVRTNSEGMVSHGAY